MPSRAEGAAIGFFLPGKPGLSSHGRTLHQHPTNQHQPLN